MSAEREPTENLSSRSSSERWGSESEGLHDDEHQQSGSELEDVTPDPASSEMGELLDRDQTVVEFKDPKDDDKDSESEAASFRSIIGEEADIIDRYYGHLREGLELLKEDASEYVRRKTCRRYERRRALAEYSQYPEGFEFIHNLPGASSRAVILLTPPEMAAIQHEDGTWERIERDVVRDGPAPYSTQWFQQNLRKNNLPWYFMQQQHLEMRLDREEAERLGIDIDALNAGLEKLDPEVLRDYQVVRYPGTPLDPQVPNATRDQMYRYRMQSHERAGLARRFPAVATLDLTHGVYLRMSDGGTSLFIDLPTASYPKAVSITSGRLRWVTQDGPTSYLSEGASIGSSRGANLPITPDDSLRSSLARAAEQHGGIVNPKKSPQGTGRWEWLQTEVDGVRAAILGYEDPEHVIEGREAGALTRGTTEDAAPIVVFYRTLSMETTTAPTAELDTIMESYPRILNPPAQPAGPGAWQYLSPESEELAVINFGGQVYNGTTLLDHPSAADIWQLRQNLILLGQEDATASVDIVWVAATAEPSIEAADILSATSALPFTPINAPNATRLDTLVPQDSAAEPTIPLSQEPDIGYGVDEDSGLAHDPTNRGECDQRYGDRRGRYQTLTIKNKRITLDRGRPTANGRPQYQRTWVYDRNGRWKQYGKPINWRSRADVEQLARWAEQFLLRNGWPAKRQAVEGVESEGEEEAEEETHDNGDDKDDKEDSEEVDYDAMD